METYAHEDQQIARKSLLAAQQMPLGGNRITESKAFDRCIGDANNIREQISEAAAVADALLTRLAGPRPEECADGAGAKDALNGGAIGELTRLQSSSLSRLADLRRTLEQIGKYV